MKPDDLLQPTPKGLYCPPGGFYIDPVRPVDRAVITHGHADHARAGHRRVLASRETLSIMTVRYGPSFAENQQVAVMGESVEIGGVTVTLYPAGHVLGSAQVLVEKDGLRIVCSGDYKRRSDPTCAAFEVVPCHVFITEATFGLPVFRHPPTEDEIAKLTRSRATFPERAHLIGAYALGKAQRVIKELRLAGVDEPIYLHGALKRLCSLYEHEGIALGPFETITGKSKGELAGKLAMSPPAAINDRWSRRMKDPVISFASGWMRVRARARQRGVELPLILSDHADWDELTATIHDTGAEEIWVTHGREEALVHYARSKGLRARPLSLVGYEDEDDHALEAAQEAE